MLDGSNTRRLTRLDELSVSKHRNDQFRTQVGKINFRSIMVKTWLCFNQLHILFKFKQ